MIDRLTVEKIKAAAGIVDVAGDFETLRKAGINYKCLCPFHDDHTPSMSISPKRNIYHCFVCGAHGNPVDFLMKHPASRLTYPDALRYLAKKYSIWIDEDTAQSDGERWKHIKPAKPRAIEDTMPLETLVMDNEAVRETMRQRDGNKFVKWVVSLPWSDEQRKRVDKTLWSYCVGQYKDGRTVFWQVDEKGRVHTGKLMMYGDNGKRIREGRYEAPGWMHNYVGSYDKKRYEMRQCLFGLHLIDKYKDVPINIVESEKTAIICAIAYGLERGLWMACGGLRNIKEAELQPLIERKRAVYLWPDRDGQEGWEVFAEGIAYEGLQIWTKFLDKNWRPEDGEKADIADIVLRLITRPETAKEQKETAVERTDGDPFLDPDEQADPRVREWRERLSRVHSSGWGRWPKSEVADVESVGEILSEHPLIRKLIE